LVEEEHQNRSKKKFIQGNLLEMLAMLVESTISKIWRSYNEDVRLAGKRDKAMEKRKK
jgi:hypothetical protein